MSNVANNTIINTVNFTNRVFSSMKLMGDFSTIIVTYINGEVERVEAGVDFTWFNELAERYFGFPPLSDCNW